MRKIHIATSVRGLMSQNDRHLKEIAPNFYIDGKSLKTTEQVRAALQEMLDEGMEWIPDVNCDNYDSTGRCLGHPCKEDHNG